MDRDEAAENGTEPPPTERDGSVRESSEPDGFTNESTDQGRQSGASAEGPHIEGRETESSPLDDRERKDPPSPRRGSTADREGGIVSAISWFRTTDDQWVALLRDVLVSLVVVAAVGGLLFAASGVWPPLVAVESDSMDPHLQKGDLVLVVEEGRFAPEFAAGGTGIVTAEQGAAKDYHRFGGPGDVIVYQPYGSDSATPIIHRAHLYVEEGENWYDRADKDVTNADSCEELDGCPAPTDGFVTKGDNPNTNNYYDQERGISSVVEPDWVRGTATVRIPWLGWIRLAASDLELPGVASV